MARAGTGTEALGAPGARRAAARRRARGTARPRPPPGRGRSPAGRHQDQVGRVVVLLEEAGDGGAVHGVDRLERAEHLAPQRVIAPQRLVRQRQHAVVALVLGLVELLEDDLALALHVVDVERRGGDHVGEQVEPHLGGGGRHPGVEGGVLVGGVGVELAAHRLDRLGDLAAGVAGGALEQQVLEEVRGAGQLGPLVAPTHADPAAEAGRAGAGDGLGDHGEPGGEVGAFDGHSVQRLGEKAGRSRSTSDRDRQDYVQGDGIVRSATTAAATTAAATIGPAGAATAIATTTATGRTLGARAELTELLADLGVERVLERDRLTGSVPDGGAARRGRRRTSWRPRPERTSRRRCRRRAPAG